MLQITTEGLRSAAIWVSIYLIFKFIFEIIKIVLLSALFGWIASLIMKKKYSFKKMVLVGFLGSLIAEIILMLVNFSFLGIIGELIMSTVFTCLVIFIGNKFFK